MFVLILVYEILQKGKDMKSALRKNALREIKNTKNRFFSIFGIVAIGVGFFSGVKAAAPDMRITSDKYYDDSSLMDFRLVSTYGFDEKDIEALKTLSGAEIYPSYYTDLLAHSDGTTPEVSRIFSMPENNSDINAVTLTGGRLPENPDECIISASDMEGSRLGLGTKVTFLNADGEFPEDMLYRNEYTVVGTFISPMFVDKTAFGSTTVGNGSIGAAFYIPEENFSVEYNTEVYIRYPELDEYICYEDGYKNRTEAITEQIKALSEQRRDERYNEIIAEADETLSEAKQELADAEAEAEKEISDGEKELADAKIKLDDAKKEIEDGERELISGEQELKDARKELDDGYKELADGRAEFEAEISDAEEKIAEAEKEIAENEKKLLDGEKEYNDGYAEWEKGYADFLSGKSRYEEGLSSYNSGKAEFDKNYAEWENGMNECEAGLTELEKTKKQLDETAFMLRQMKNAYGENNPQYIAAKSQYEQGLSQYEAGKAQLEAAKTELSAAEPQLKEAEAELTEAKKTLDETAAQLITAEEELNSAKLTLDEARAELENGKKQLEDGKKTLEENKKELQNGKAEAEKEFSEAEQKLIDGEKQYNDGIKELENAKITLSDGKKEYEDGLKEYEDGVKELEEGRAEAEEKIADAKEEIADAEKELSELEKPKWYVFNRNDNPGYSEYGENANRINNIASVFPVFFILVAALVCLTTMTRMVEDQRTQIGTLKALGYKNSEIITKYMFYAAAAAVSGAVAGVLIGMQLFPVVIIKAYGMMYNIPELCTPIDITTAAWAISASLGAILLTVFFTCRSALSEQSAQLMRPKAPKIGKRIFLERITPLWKGFNFSSKVTARNLFRYKRKMFMSVIGIAGCTALLMTGFALYDSINDIIRLQYGEIQFYDGIVAYDNSENPEAVEEIEGILKSLGEENNSVSVFQKQMTVSVGEKNVDAYIAVPSDPEKFGGFFVLRDRKSGDGYKLEDGKIYIDEKMSLLLGEVKGGDKLTVYKSETEPVEVTLTAYFENYPGHFVYMTENTYKELFKESPEYNSLYFSHSITPEEEDGLAERILKTEGTLAVSFTSDMKINYQSMLDTLAAVIILIIICAGALAYVVMYNLTNINITERIREIATLKVLGFYDKEVDSYIFRENIILTLMGTVVGLILGVFLALFVITTAEVDLVMFGRNIYPKSFILSAVFTLGFSVLVTLIMHKKLKNVDMIEALKSIE